MGLRTGPIQEGSQPGPRLDRKARAGKDPKAHSRAKANQACISLYEYLSILRTAVFARNGDATRPYGHTSPHAHARSLAAASPNPDAVLMRLEAQRSNVLELHSGPTAVDGRASVSSKLVEGGGARSWE